MPALEGKIGGLGIQVQTAAVSLLDITLKLEQDTDYEAVCAAVVKASEGSLHGVLGYTEQPLVSADFVGDQRSAVVDFPAGLQLGPGMVKLVVWFDSEISFGARLADLLVFIQQSDADRAPSRESSIASDNYASSVCVPSKRAKCEECIKWREFCPYCSIRKINTLLELVA